MLDTQSQWKGRCTVFGRRLDGKMTFPNDEYTLQTDDGFRQQTQPIRHQSHSILEVLPINMISTFPLDPMNMVILRCGEESSQFIDKVSSQTTKKHEPQV